MSWPSSDGPVDSTIGTRQGSSLPRSHPSWPAGALALRRRWQAHPGGLGTLIGDRLKLDPRETRSLGFSGVSGMLAAFITSPINGAVLGLESAKGAVSGLALQAWVLFPSLLPSSVAVVVFVGLSGHFFGTLYVFPEFMSRTYRDLLAAIPLGLLGGVVGISRSSRCSAACSEP